MVGAAMSALGVVGEDYGHFLDDIVVHLCILPCDVGRASHEVEDGAVKVLQRLAVGIGHGHLSHAGIQDEVGLQAWVGCIGQDLRSTA